MGHSENFILGQGKDRDDILALNDDEEPNIPDGLSDEELQYYLEEFANRVELHNNSLAMLLSINYIGYVNQSKKF